MLAWKLMKATERACESVCMGEEAAGHYGYCYTGWRRWCDWWTGLVAGWLDDCEPLPASSRVWRFASQKLGHAWLCIRNSCGYSEQRSWNVEDRK